MIPVLLPYIVYPLLLFKSVTYFWLQIITLCVKRSYNTVLLRQKEAYHG